MRVQMVPSLESFRSHESGIKRVLEAYTRHLPEFGIELVPESDGRYDVKVVHAGMANECDIAQLHGLYWTADYQAMPWEWKANASVIRSIRLAREVIVPSEWVAKALRRDVRLDPHVIGHGIEWEEWADHGEENLGYVLWNKNRAADVCDPYPVGELAKRMQDVKFVTTFAPPMATGNVQAIGLQQYAEMKRLVQQAGVYLATTKETFGIGMLEAMAAGVPVLGFRFGGAAELVEHQVTGWLAHPGDFDGLAEGLAYCLGNRDALGGAGREAARRYSWREACARIADVYRLAATKEPPSVAVVIPSFNYAGQVGRAIQSALEQDYGMLEAVVVVDDGSPDGGATESAVMGWADRDRRVRYVRQENSGVAVARNVGIREAGDVKYICCLDADDAIEPDFLSICIRPLEEDRSLGIAYTGLQYVLPDGNTGQSKWPGEFDYDKQLQGQNQVPTCCVFRRSMWERLGGYRQRYAPQGAGAEDAEFWLRAGAYGFGAVRATARPLFVYSWYSGNVGKAVREGRYTEPDWRGWHPWTRDGFHPFASVATPKRWSHAVRSYDSPWVAVVIPVGPGHEGLAIDALDSVEAQTLRQWEAIVVNDTGGPLDLAGYPYVKVVDTPGRMGAGHARNRGVEAAEAPFVTFLDADDFLQPDFLKVTMDVRFETGCWVYTDILSLHDDGSVNHYEVDDWDLESLWKDGLGAVTALHTVDEWRRVGGFDEEMGSREDWDFQLKLAKAGFCGVRVALPLVSYRLPTGGRREGQYKETVKMLRERYPLEVLQMGCTDCPRKSAMRKAVPPANWMSKEEAGFIEVEYTGKDKSDRVIKGQSTQRPYLLGNNKYHKTAWVHPDDLAGVLRFPAIKMLESRQQAGTEPAVIAAPTGARR